jgi:hypothetical protein
MNFLNRFWKILTDFFLGAIRPNISYGDLLSRFLTHKNHFSSTRVKPSAFMPKNQKLSVFMTDNLAAEEIWILGMKYVTPNIYGRAELANTIISKIGLRVEQDDMPKRHAHITGWPNQKSEQKLYALKLAEKSSLFLRSI